MTDTAAPSDRIREAVFVTCDSCGHQNTRHVYEVRVADGTAPRCLICALRHWPLVRRSLMVAAIVGTLLIAINQGNVIIDGEFPGSLIWKIPLTYVVPYCVATSGAMMNARQPVRQAAASEE